ncbi:MAG: hypothetical protein H0W06_00540 [Chloroflexia bacterium]|nr:hypothetical protein [Chloroflexia bacterium]
MTTQTNEKTQRILADWVGDIVALESHIEEAMDRQLKLSSDNAEITSTIQRFHELFFFLK